MRVAFLLALLFGALAGAAQAHPPYGLVADDGGNVYFSDLEAVWRLRPDGRVELFRPPMPGHHVHELALARDGAIEGEVNRYEPETETFYGGLWRRTVDGSETWPLEPTPAPPLGFGTYSDRGGNRYVALWPSNEDRRTMLFRRSPEGTTRLLHGPREAVEGFRQVLISSVGGMAPTPDGGIVLADGRALRRVSPTGTVTSLFEAAEGANLRAVSAAPDGRILAADMTARTVIAVAADGSAEVLYRETEAWLPTAALLLRGRLFVLEANAEPREYVDRVRLVEVADGRARTVARPGGPDAIAPPTGKGASGAGSRFVLAAAVAAGAAALIAAAVAARRRKG